VRLDHGAIEVQSGEDPQKFAAFVNARAPSISIYKGFERNTSKRDFAFEAKLGEAGQLIYEKANSRRR
jgi:hypothetical protein